MFLPPFVVTVFLNNVALGMSLLTANRLGEGHAQGDAPCWCAIKFAGQPGIKREKEDGVR